jgi:hypothetical protein
MRRSNADIWAAMAARQFTVSMATSATYLIAIAVVSAKLTIALKGNQATLDGNVKSNFGDAPTNELVNRTTLENVTGASRRAVARLLAMLIGSYRIDIIWRTGDAAR